jgi:hypothetical protein
MIFAGAAGASAARLLIGSRPKPVVTAVAAREAVLTKSRREIGFVSFIMALFG